MNKNVLFVVIAVVILILAGIILLDLKPRDNVLSVPTDTSSAQNISEPIQTELNTNVNDGLTEKFDFPYPIQWTENNVSYSLVGASLGTKLIPVNRFPTPSINPNEGKSINALGLLFKVKNNTTSAGCVPMNIRRLTNEEGDLASPENQQVVFANSGGCSLAANSTDQYEVIFAVPTEDGDFHITTGGQSNIFFEVKADGSNLNVIDETKPQP